MNIKLTSDDLERSEIISKDAISTHSYNEMYIVATKESSDNDSNLSKNKNKKVKFAVNSMSVNSERDIKLTKEEFKNEKEMITLTPYSHRSSFRKKRYESEQLESCTWETFSVILNNMNKENKLESRNKLNETGYDNRRITETTENTTSNVNERENCCEAYSKCLVF